MQALSFTKILILSFFITGCTQMSNRSYLAEMSDEGNSSYGPQDDFQIVSGDTGRDWENDEERRLRTPASESEMQADRTKRFLKNELKTLEGQQSEQSLIVYEKYKQKLSTISEKIYYLKLTPFERREYLDARGFITDGRVPASGQANSYGPRISNLAAGMTKVDVVHTWGRPSRVEVAGNPTEENERWLYSNNGASKYIYFEAGRVEGWE